MEKSHLDGILKEQRLIKVALVLKVIKRPSFHS